MDRGLGQTKLERRFCQTMIHVRRYHCQTCKSLSDSTKEAKGVLKRLAENVALSRGFIWWESLQDEGNNETGAQTWRARRPRRIH